MRLLDAAQTAAALPLPALIHALRRRFRLGCEMPPRQVHVVGGTADQPVTSLVMAAWVPGLCYGVKVINIAPGNGARGLPGLHASYLMHDATTGMPLALLDGDVLTARRTAAASALAASWLAPADASHLAVLGAGRIATLLPQAHGSVRPIRRVSLWARRREQAEPLAQRWRSQGYEVHLADNAQAAVRDADIVSCATLATEPVVQGRWLRPGSHLDLIGSFTPQMREADDDCLRGAALFVDTEDALAKSGDLIGPLARGVIQAADLRGTLTSLSRGESVLPLPGQRTVFKSVGTALEDLAAAMLALGLHDDSPQDEQDPER